MRVRTLEIRWHDSKPISTCDFQPLPHKKARPAAERGYTSQTYRLATGGEDNHVRVSASLSLRIAVDCGEGRAAALRTGGDSPPSLSIRDVGVPTRCPKVLGDRATDGDP